ncbi:MAG: lysophospholipid acyltransferase family protein [Acidobacteriota bacterium]
MTTTAPPTKLHAPETGGLLRRLLGDYHVTGVFWYRFHSRGLQVIPEWSKRPIINIFTGFFFIALRRIRSAIVFNLTPVLGPSGCIERQRRIWRTMKTFAWCLNERYENLNGDLKLEADIEGEAVWQNAMAEDRGLIVVTAHIGHWEVGAQLPTLREGQTVHVVREAEVDPKAQELIRQLMQNVSGGRFQVHFSDEADTAFGARLLAALRRGDIVALQGDRPRAGGQTLTTRMFQHDYSVPLGPAALARAARVPLVPVFIFRDGRARSRVSIRQPIEVERTADRTRDLQTAMQKVTTEIEGAIRFRPHQWFCFNRVWKV